MDPDRDPSSHLSDKEQELAAERTAVGAHIVHEAIRAEGEDELSRPGTALAWSAIAAGLSMGFSLVAQGLLHAFLPDEPWAVLLTSLGYTVGFLVVVLGRQQLFTENTLTVVLPLMLHPSAHNFARLGKLWGIVLGGNVLGAALFAWAASRGAIFDEPVRAAFLELSRTAWQPHFSALLVRGIYGGWLIALMIWLLPAAEHSRPWIIVVITYLVGLGGFSHSIAGSVEVLYLVATGEVTLTNYLGGFLLPTVIGNTIGGVSLVAALNHAQVVAGRRRHA